MPKLIHYNDDTLIGDVTFDFSDHHFPLDEIASLLEESRVLETVFEQHHLVNNRLYKFIDDAEPPIFLLPYILHFIEKVTEILPTYNLFSFEFWLANYYRPKGKKVSLDEELLIRGKIMGLHVDRMSYGEFFPLKQNSFCKGPLFVCSHQKPDVDTTVGAFNVFLYSFAAKVSADHHYWHLPSGLPEATEIGILFSKVFNQVFERAIPIVDDRIVLRAVDLLSSDDVEKRTLQDESLIGQQDRHVVVIENSGVEDSLVASDIFLGDWQSEDVDQVQYILHQWELILASFQTEVTQEFIKLFNSSNPLSKDKIREGIQKITERSVLSCEFANSMGDLGKIKKFIDLVLGIKNIQPILSDLGDYTSLGSSFEKCYDNHLQTDVCSDLFSVVTEVIEQLFRFFNLAKKNLSLLRISFRTKKKVLERDSSVASYASSVDEMIALIKEKRSLTVVYRDSVAKKSNFLGVINNSVLHDDCHASMVWVDFSSKAEVNFEDKIELLAVIDHHKSSFKTKQPIEITASATQSCNTLIAEKAFRLHDGVIGTECDIKDIDQKISSLSHNTQEGSRCLRRYLKKKEIAYNNDREKYWIHKEKKFLEMYQYTYAILDDTDLLQKCTKRDLIVLASLLNRMKSIMLKREVETVNFDGIDVGDSSLEKMKKRLLENEDLKSIYSKNLIKKEELYERFIRETVAGKNDSLFNDSKLIDRYALVSQFKYLPENRLLIEEKNPQIIKRWEEYFLERYDNSQKEHNLAILMMTSLKSIQEIEGKRIDSFEFNDEIRVAAKKDDISGIIRQRDFVRKVLSTQSHKIIRIIIEGSSTAGRKLYQLIKDEDIEIEFYESEKQLVTVTLLVNRHEFTSRKSDVSPHL